MSKELGRPHEDWKIFTLRRDKMKKKIKVGWKSVGIDGEGSLYIFVYHIYGLDY